MSVSSVDVFPYHRDLHSFPTRRSSDLAPHVPAGPRLAVAIVAVAIAYHFSLSTLASEWRSEEHTSELQSRFDLVCRLLLEKKKRDEHRLEESFAAVLDDRDGGEDRGEQ